MTSPPARAIFSWSIWKKHVWQIPSRVIIGVSNAIFPNSCPLGAKIVGCIRESLDLRKEQHRPHDREQLKLLSSNQVQAQQANWATAFQSKLQQQSLLFQLLQAKYLRLNHQQNLPTLKMSIPWLKMEYSKWIQEKSADPPLHWLTGTQLWLAKIYVSKIMVLVTKFQILSPLLRQKSIRYN